MPIEAKSRLLQVGREQLLLPNSVAFPSTQNPCRPLDLIQAELRKRFRALQPGAKTTGHESFAVTVNGIAAGMKYG